MFKSTIDKATGFEKRFENIGTVVFKNSTAASKAVAKAINCGSNPLSIKAGILCIAIVPVAILLSK